MLGVRSPIVHGQQALDLNTLTLLLEYGESVVNS